jgi:hypothetical protein
MKTPKPLPVSTAELWDSMELCLWSGRLYPRRVDTKRHWRLNTPLGTTKPAANGYHYISYDGARILLHRAVFKWIHGVDPLGEIDHIDRNKQNNCPINLRYTDRRGQSINSPVHINALGVRQLPDGKWRAYHCAGGRQFSLSGLTSRDEALAARKAMVLVANGLLGTAP